VEAEGRPVEAEGRPVEAEGRNVLQLFVKFARLSAH